MVVVAAVVWRWRWSWLLPRVGLAVVVVAVVVVVVVVGIPPSLAFVWVASRDESSVRPAPPTATVRSGDSPKQDPSPGAVAVAPREIRRDAHSSLRRMFL